MITVWRVVDPVQIEEVSTAKPIMDSYSHCSFLIFYVKPVDSASTQSKIAMGAGASTWSKIAIEVSAHNFYQTLLFVILYCITKDYF